MKKKIFNYFLNLLLVVIVLILFIPSWRISFQAWYNGLFINNVEFVETNKIALSESEQNWALFDMESQITNFADLKGKPIVLSFWATWCAPCRIELAEIKTLQEKFKEKIHFVSASEESIEVIKDSGLADDYDFLYSTPSFPKFANITSYPTLLLIDSDMHKVFETKGAGKLNSEKNINFLNGLVQNK